jgi:nicotinic acid mononucleotide adenylyltransferase
MTQGRIGCYPGTFNPPTVAHLAVAESALEVGRLVRVDLVVSRLPLGKETPETPTLDDRVAVLREVAATRPWLGVAVLEAQLIVDAAEGYDAVVMGADKWRQVTDPTWYGRDAAARDAAVARLPRVLVAARAGDRPDGVELLAVDDAHGEVSATAIRAGRTGARSWMLPEAAAFDARTGAWSDPARDRH